MLWMLLILLLATPVRLTIEAHYAAGLTLQLLWRVWGLPFRRRIDWRRDAHGSHLLTQFEEQAPHEPPSEQVRRFLVAMGTLLRTDKARRSFFRALMVRRLDARINMGLKDASSTAVAAGIMDALMLLLPQRIRQVARIRVTPDFLRQRTALQARCIIFFHLGSLLPAAAMTLAAAMMEAREHPAAPMTEEV